MVLRSRRLLLPSQQGIQISLLLRASFQDHIEPQRQSIFDFSNVLFRPQIGADIASESNKAFTVDPLAQNRPRAVRTHRAEQRERRRATYALRKGAGGRQKIEPPGSGKRGRGRPHPIRGGVPVFNRSLSNPRDTNCSVMPVAARSADRPPPNFFSPIWITPFKKVPLVNTTASLSISIPSAVLTPQTVLPLINKDAFN